MTTTHTQENALTDTLRIDFTPKYLPILDVFKAANDIRYYLCGVYVEKAPQGGVYLVSTDGRTMAVIYDKDGRIDGADSAIISVAPGLVAGAKTSCSRAGKGLPYRVTVRGTRAMVAVPDAEGMEIFIQPGKCLIEAKFPAWRKVMPDFEKLKPGAGADCLVNAKYMARFSRVVSERFTGIALWQEASSNPIVVQVLALPEAVFIVMPMRDQGSLQALKAFAPPAPEPTVLETAAEVAEVA